jgi:hypothetical protein
MKMQEYGQGNRKKGSSKTGISKLDDKRNRRDTIKVNYKKVCKEVTSNSSTRQYFGLHGTYGRMFY